MTIHLSNDLKIFITTNLDVDRRINQSGFTLDNTKEIIIQTGSLNYDIAKTYEYLDNSLTIDSQIMIESPISSSMSLGTANFSTYLNTSSTGPFDAWLWNSLSNEIEFPGDKWIVDAESQKMKLLRDTTSTQVFGIVVVSGKMAYLLDACRLETCNLSYDINDLVKSTWGIKFEELRTLQNMVVNKLNDMYSFSSGLIGSASLVDLTEYKFCPAKMLLVNVSTTSGDILGKLAATKLSIDIINTLNFIEENEIDRQKLGQIFAGASTFSISGTLSFYTRSAGSYSNTLMQDLITTKSSPFINKSYSFSIELPQTKTKKLCDIVLGECTASIRTDVGTVLTNRLDFKLVDGLYNDNCFIKFYT
jgi:hypothetical protein